MTKPTGFAGIRDTLGQINNSMTFPSYIDKENNNRIYDKAVSPSIRRLFASVSAPNPLGKSLCTLYQDAAAFSIFASLLFIILFFIIYNINVIRRHMLTYAKAKAN